MSSGRVSRWVDRALAEARADLRDLYLDGGCLLELLLLKLKWIRWRKP